MEEIVTEENDDPLAANCVEGNSTSIYPRRCETCSKIFKNRHSFWNHRIVCSGAVIVCEECSHVYRSRLAFYEHNCQRRKQGYCKRLTKCIDPNCESMFFRRTEMLRHMEAVHSNNIEESTLHFDSLEEFEKWKEKESQKCFTYFRKQRGTKKLKDNEYSSFVCQFDAPNRKKGSKIPNYSCPARMQVSRNESGKVSVRYISTHNHSLTHANTKFHPYSKTVVNYIKKLLNSGVSPKTIFNILKRKCNEPDFFQLKDHSITVKYINNIKYQLKSKGELNDKSSSACSKSKHKNGLEIPVNTIVYITDSSWRVLLDKNENVFCLVEKFHSKCPQPENCLYRCNYSICEGLCSHMYGCSCSDPSSLCKHIHRIQSLNKRKVKLRYDNVIMKRENFDRFKNEENDSLPVNVSEDDLIVSVIIDENSVNNITNDDNGFVSKENEIDRLNINSDIIFTNENEEIEEICDSTEIDDSEIKRNILINDNDSLKSVTYDKIDVDINNSFMEIVMNNEDDKEIVIEEIEEIPQDQIEVEITDEMTNQKAEEEFQHRTEGAAILKKLTQAYIEVSESSLPDVNRILQNALELVTRNIRKN